MPDEPDIHAADLDIEDALQASLARHAELWMTTAAALKLADLAEDLSRTGIEVMGDNHAVGETLLAIARRLTVIIVQARTR